MTIGAQVMLDTRIPKGDNFTDEAAEAASSKDKCRKKWMMKYMWFYVYVYTLCVLW